MLPFARGFSSFGGTRESFRRFLRACARTGLACDVVVASGFRDRKSNLPGAGSALAVFQDLPADSPRLSPLIRRVIFPAWLHGVPVCFISSARREEYPGKDITARSLHTDLPAVERFLLREQMVGLLEMSGRRASTRPEAIPIDGDLDPSQAAAVEHGEGPIRVLAPAGSGKTKTLVNRICSLVNNGVDPGSILPLAFNTKAASEMNARLGARGLGGIEARTFHSLGYEITRAGGGLRFDAQTESAVTRALMKEALESVAPGAGEGEVLEQAVNLLSAGKMDLLGLESMQLTLRGQAFPFGSLFERCLQMQEARGVMNYDDMIYFALRILIDNDRIRNGYQQKFRYILVDEYQDLNRAQNLLLRILALPENNLFVVGDDDQLIYGWRGAEVRSIMEFPEIHSCARTCVLSTNYRSGGVIVAHAGWLIGMNKERVHKTVSPRPGASPGRFEIVLGRGLWEEAQAAADWIQTNDGGRPWHETAVLYRYNALRFIVALALDARGIPHSEVDRGLLFESRVGMDIAAWLTILIAPESAVREDVARVLRRPEKILARPLAESLETWRDIEALAGRGILSGRDEERLAVFLRRVDSLRARAPFVSSRGLLAAIDSATRLRESYTQRVSSLPDPEDADDSTYLDVIEAESETVPSPADFLSQMRALRPAARVAVPRAEETPERDKVVLRTIHRAKGNEFFRVVYFDLSRRHRPGPEQSEEERRVAYVALTRARDALLITANGRRQSPFLREAALNPLFSGRMREDMESELNALRKQLLRRAGNVTLGLNISALEEELRCRSMLNVSPPFLDR